jgi:hypothetical protein
MPALQTVNFGADPRANAMGAFAKNFLGALTAKVEENKNDALFKQISDKYGPNADPLMVLKDLATSQGIGQGFKDNKTSIYTKIAELENKQNKSIADQAVLDQRKAELKSRQESNVIAANRAETEKKKADNNAKKLAQALPGQIAKNNNLLLKDRPGKMPIYDVND